MVFLTKAPLSCGAFLVILKKNYFEARNSIITGTHSR